MTKTTKTTTVPDATGTIFVGGHENDVEEFRLKNKFLKSLTEDTASMKRDLRATVRGVLAAAAAGVKRVFIRGVSRGGVMVTIPDYSMDVNRLSLKDSVIKSLTKAGGPEALGIPAPELFDTTIVPGGETIQLRGRWLKWFMDQLVVTGKVKIEGDPDITHSVIEESTTTKLKFDAVAKLQALAASGNSAAQNLLDGSLKDYMVKDEDE